MANELSTVLVTKWNKETQMAFQQKEARLNQIGQVVKDVGAETYKFPKLAAITAVAGPALGSDHAGIASVHTEASITLADRYAPVFLNELEMLKAAENDSLRQTYQENSRRSINNWTDSTIVTALDTLNTTGVTATGAFTYTKFLEAQELLNAADVDMEDNFLVVGARQVRDMLGISQFTSADYASLHKVYNGGIASVLGVNVIMSNKLTLTTTFRDCFLVNKRAVGIAYACDPKTTIDWIPEKSQFLANTKVSMGAVTIQQAGVVEIKCDET